MTIALLAQLQLEANIRAAQLSLDGELVGRLNEATEQLKQALRRIHDDLLIAHCSLTSHTAHF